MTTKGPYTPRRRCLFTRLTQTGALEPWRVFGWVGLCCTISALGVWATLR